MAEKIFKIISIIISIITLVLGILAIVFFIKYSSINPDFSSVANGAPSPEVFEAQELKADYKNLCVSFSLYLAIACVILSIVNLVYFFISRNSKLLQVK
ncbi:MAG: hypothetical protein ACI4T8_01210 [Christensenellales bacterium]